MDTALTVVLGALWGAAWGLAKYLLLWRRLFTGKGNAHSRISLTLSGSLLMNLICLLLPFLLRGLIPWPLVPSLIASAVALSVTSRWPVLWRAKREQAGEVPSDPAAQAADEP